MNSKPAKQAGNKGIVEVKDGKNTIALFYSKKLRADGVRFLTPENFPIQIGLLEHRDGKIVPMHRHRDFSYKIKTSEELLYVEKGKIEVTIANRLWKILAKKILQSGDFVLFTGAAHSVKLYPGSRVFEIKQGPYPGDSKAKIYK